MLIRKLGTKNCSFSVIIQTKMSKEVLSQLGIYLINDSSSSGPCGLQNIPPATYSQNLGDYQLENLEDLKLVVPQNIST